MALSKDDLQAIAALLKPIQDDVSEIKQDISEMKQDIVKLQENDVKMQNEIVEMRKDISELQENYGGLQDRITSIELHLENTTDKNIQLLAENFIELIDKLNAAIPTAEKNYMYEIKVNYLEGRVGLLEKEVKELKSKIA